MKTWLRHQSAAFRSALVRLFAHPLSALLTALAMGVAISLPAGADPATGLPVAVQIAAPRWRDHDVLAAALAIEVELAGAALRREECRGRADQLNHHLGALDLPLVDDESSVLAACAANMAARTSSSMRRSTERAI